MRPAARCSPSARPFSRAIEWAQPVIARALYYKPLLSIVAAMALQGCASWSDNPAPDVLCTTNILGDTAASIMVGGLRASALMGPGVDPHLYTPTQRDILTLARARVIVFNGLHLEGQMARVLAALARTRPVLAATDAIDRAELLRVPDSEAYDPHVWFDVRLWARIVPWLAHRLGEHFPTQRDELLEAAIRYQAELLALDRWVQEQIERIPEPRRVLVTAHDAFRYFGRRYGIEVVGLQGISTSSEAALQDLHRLVELIVRRRIPAIFVETSVPRRAIEALQAACRARGHDVRIGGALYSDALGPPGSGADTYIGMVRTNVQTIVRALTAEPTADRVAGASSRVTRTKEPQP